MILVMLSCNHIPDVSFLEVLQCRAEVKRSVCAVRELVPLCAGSACAVSTYLSRESQKVKTKVTFSGKLSHLAVLMRSWLLALSVVL